MCAERRQIWRSLIWLRLRRGFSAEHKESIILLLLLLLLLLTLLLRGTDIWRGRLWDGAKRRELVKERSRDGSETLKGKYSRHHQRGSKRRRLSAWLNSDADAPVIIWKFFYPARLMQIFCFFSFPEFFWTCNFIFRDGAKNLSLNTEDLMLFFCSSVCGPYSFYSI